MKNYGIITKIDLPDANVPMVKLWLEQAGCERVFCVSNVTGEGIERKMTVTLKYAADKRGVISGIKRISKPGLRVYAKQNEIPSVLNGLGIAIISTSEGMMTDRDARKKHTGGEVIAYVW